MKLRTGKRQHPRAVLVYGPHGVGKTTFAAESQNHVIMNFEDGLNNIDCRSTEKLRTWTDTCNVLQELVTDPPDLDWIVLDTLDWCEQIIHDEIAEAAGKESIADIGYGNGFKLALAKWKYLIRGLDYLREHRNCGILLLAHAVAKRYDSPDSDSYDRMRPALHDSAANLFQEWCDEVLYASYRVHTRKETQSFDRSRTLAIGTGERFLRTSESPAVLAKNRLGLDDEIPFEFEYYQAKINEFFSENC